MPNEPYAPALVGARIRAIRRFADWSQRDLGKFLDIDRELVSRWENGKSYPSLAVSAQLCQRFGLTLDFIFLGDRGALPFSVAEKLLPLVEDEIQKLQQQ